MFLPGFVIQPAAGVLVRFGHQAPLPCPTPGKTFRAARSAGGTVAFAPLTSGDPGNSGGAEKGVSQTLFANILRQPPVQVNPTYISHVNNTEAVGTHRNRVGS